MASDDEGKGRCVEDRAACPFVYVVVLNFNGLDINDTCIKSLFASDYLNYQVLFVDNGSTDGSVERIRQQYPTVEILENKKNLLFAAGNNRGVELALQQGADYIFILNNDTAIDPACLSLLVSFMEDNQDSGAVQPMLCLMEHPTIIASAGCRISLSGRAWDDGFGTPCTSFGIEPREVSGVTGGAMLVRAQAFCQAGLFNEQYGMYFEDVDLSWRVRKNGYSLFVVPEAHVLHMVSATTQKGYSALRIRLTEANSYRLIVDHFPLLLVLAGYPLSLFFSLGVTIRAFLHGHPENGRAAMKGALDGLVMFIPSLLRRMRSSSVQKSTAAKWIDWKILFPPSCRFSEKEKSS